MEHALIAGLQRLLETRYAAWQVTNVQIIGRGLEALVCRAQSIQFGPMAIKIPWRRWITNDNDADLDARALLQQEAAFADHSRCYRVPTPAMHALHLGNDDSDFLVSEYIPHDHSPVSHYEFGQVVRAIHEAPVRDVHCVAQRDALVPSLIAERLSQRAQVVERLAGIQLGLPAVHRLRTLLQWPEARRSLLHMDMRPANVLTRDGHIVAVIDWSNALIGDPALELARIAEYGYLDAEFYAGYGMTDGFAHVPRSVELLYRLDTAVMLAVVFLSESPDPQCAQSQGQRVIKLSAQLSALLK